MSIEDLETQISYYASKYYEGEPIISDEQFDSLVDKLRELNPNSSVLKTGWGFEVFEDKVKHKYSHIGSLDKCKSYDEIPDLYKDTMVYISPKLDGLSAVAYYINGKLVKGVTRGNGEVGKDITDKLFKIVGPEIDDKKFTGAIRGELIISNSNWELLNQKYTGLISPRNFSAGIINRKDIDDDIQYIDLVVYKIVGQENKLFKTDRGDILHWLAMNFEHSVPDYYYPILNEPSWNMYYEMTFEEFKKLGYGLDGLVLTKPDVKFNIATNGYTYTEVAFKFQAESAITTIKNINWELSRTSRMIPVAEVEPVELSGAIVQNATCNNAKWVKDLGLGIGAEVVITRSGEVIPKILEVVESVNEPLPSVCPVCGEKLEWEGVDLKCNNDRCPNIDYSNLQQWCEIIGETDGLQYTIMKQYLDKYGVSTLADLYANIDFILNDLKSKKLSITETKIFEFFEKLSGKYSITADKVLMALNIPRLGDKTAKLLMYEPELICELYEYAMRCSTGVEKSSANVYDKLYEIVKDATAVSILDNLDRVCNLGYLWDRNKLCIIFCEKPTNVKYVAVTGALTSMKRKDFEKYISEYGYVLTSNIKQCEYLITNDVNSGSSKNKKAIEYNIPIITEENFLKKLSKI